MKQVKPTKGITEGSNMFLVIQQFTRNRSKARLSHGDEACRRQSNLIKNHGKEIASAQKECEVLTRGQL